MSNPDPDKVKFSSRYSYFLNSSVEEGTVSITAQSTPAGEAKSYSVSIPVQNASNYTQVKINFSHDSSNWYIFPCFKVTLDTNFDIEVTGSYDSNSLDLTFYVVNETGGTETNATTTVTVKAYVFETPD